MTAKYDALLALVRTVLAGNTEYKDLEAMAAEVLAMPNDTPLDQFKALLAAGGLAQGDVLNALHDADPNVTDHEGTIEAARSNYAMGSDDEIEIDDKPLLSVADDGVWVSAWVWVSIPKEDEEEWSCDRCGETAQDGSGECITCDEGHEEEATPCKQHRDTGRGVCADCGTFL